MIRDLRKKFILVAMLSTMLVLTAIMGVVNSVSLLGLAAVFVLVVIFSRMVFRPVEESIQKQKRFITDASHELKTPLTIIDANTEVMEMESGESQYHGREQKWQRINDYRYLIKKDQRRKNTRWTNCPSGIFSFY